MRTTLRTPLAICVLVFFAARISAIEVAGELFVDVDANDPSAGTATWVNNGTLGDLEEVGDPLTNVVAGRQAVAFNQLGTDDAYQTPENAPAGLVGVDPTRSIEVWAHNPDIVAEETLVAWGKRGGPAGSNMSFNYGSHPDFGAVGHWGGPDIGWAGTPAADAWHHLVYTYDGTTTRVYADGFLTNMEVLGAGVINTHPDTKITLASQLEADGVTLSFGGIRGVLNIGKVRIHDGVLTPQQIFDNFNEEAGEFGLPESAPTIDGAPVSDLLPSGASQYERTVSVRGLPFPDVAVESPAGATLSSPGPGEFTVSYDIPDPAPGSFTVRITATNTLGAATAEWEVRQPLPGVLEIAGELFVDVCASDESAGTAEWINNGTLGNFTETGDPVIVERAGVRGVNFNEGLGAGGPDVYVGDLAPAGLTGPDPTRTIEVWMHNSSIAAEEALVAWGRRGGPNGSNLGFHHGTHPDFGAVGHWGGQDIGWGAEVPVANRWHHLVYTYDGTTTRVYANGELKNSEVLGAGAINTHPDTPILVGAEHNGNVDGFEILGSLTIGKVRVHDGVLSDEQVRHNFGVEREDFIKTRPPEFNRVPGDDVVLAGSAEYVSTPVTAEGIPDPTLSVIAPAGGTIDGNGVVTVPLPGGASFEVIVQALNSEGAVEASWTVTVVDGTSLIDAGELFVDLRAGDASAGTASWVNNGTLSDFVEVGDPIATSISGVPAVSFNEGEALDSYQSQESAPAGLVGNNPTRTIEVWGYNPPELVPEETILSWGRRGGPDGSNVSFNWGTNGTFGAVGHWGSPDMGWGAVPPAGEWRHLVYTFDGFDGRMYDNGVMTSSEPLAGALNTHPDTKITLAAQLEPDGVTLNVPLRGSMSLGLVRIHDEALTANMVLNNYLASQGDFQPSTLQIGGDCNQDGTTNFSDVVCLIGIQFPGYILGGGVAACSDNGVVDVNGDNSFDISDILYLANHLMGGGDPPTQGTECDFQPAPNCADNPNCL